MALPAEPSMCGHGPLFARPPNPKPPAPKRTRSVSSCLCARLQLAAPPHRPPPPPRPPPKRPENIFFMKDGYMKLGDFGLAIDAAVERPKSRVGTLGEGGSGAGPGVGGGRQTNPSRNTLRLVPSKATNTTKNLQTPAPASKQNLPKPLPPRLHVPRGGEPPHRRRAEAHGAAGQAAGGAGVHRKGGGHRGWVGGGCWPRGRVLCCVVARAVLLAVARGLQ